MHGPNVQLRSISRFRARGLISRFDLAAPSASFRVRPEHQLVLRKSLLGVQAAEAAIDMMELLPLCRLDPVLVLVLPC